MSHHRKQQLRELLIKFKEGIDKNISIDLNLNLIFENDRTVSITVIRKYLLVN